jgi:hypothetical protein
MKSRQTNGPAIAAAKAGSSTATAYRIEADPRLPSYMQQYFRVSPPVSSPDDADTRTAGIHQGQPKTPRSIELLVDPK